MFPDINVSDVFAISTHNLEFFGLGSLVTLSEKKLVFYFMHHVDIPRLGVL
jgi:ABC-type anion transport system duplicated permease subunit